MAVTTKKKPELKDAAEVSERTRKIMGDVVIQDVRATINRKKKKDYEEIDEAEMRGMLEWAARYKVKTVVFKMLSEYRAEGKEKHPRRKKKA